MAKQPTKGDLGVYLLYTPQNVTLETVNALIDQVRELTEKGVPRVTVLISSPGGNVYAGLLAHNFLKGSPIELTTHNIGICDSITAIIYAAGSRRLSVPHGRFLLHGVSASFPANSALSETQLEERVATLKSDTDNIAGVIAGVTDKTEPFVHAQMRQGVTLEPEKAVEWGLVHEIVEELHPPGAQVIRVA